IRTGDPEPNGLRGDRWLRASSSRARPPACTTGRESPRDETRGSMKAVAVTPGKQHSARLIDLPGPHPGPHEVLVRIHRVGIDATDLEIDRAAYGEAPPGSDVLVLGHECVGTIEEVGSAVDGLAPGDLVVPMVRRPDDCKACAAGE